MFCAKPIQSFACLKCPECDFNTKEETVFQDHAVEKHPLSFVLFGKLKSLNLTSVIFPNETEEELNSNVAMQEDVNSDRKIGSNDKTVHLVPQEKCAIAANPVKKKFAFQKKITLQHATSISLHARFTPSKNTSTIHAMRQKSEVVSESVRLPNGNCQSKNLEQEKDSTDQNFVDLDEIKKVEMENLDQEDPLNVCGMRKKRKGSQPKKLNTDKGQFETKLSSVQEGNEPFKCAFCDTVFDQVKSLKLHMASIHEGKKPFKCSICDYKCSQKGNLTQHIASTHESKKPFKCSICDYKCSRK